MLHMYMLFDFGWQCICIVIVYTNAGIIGESELWMVKR